MTSVKEIENLISILPKKDIPIALNFVKNRDFESLQELVNSDVIKFEKHVSKLTPESKEYFVAISTLDNCINLKTCVDEYLAQFQLDALDESDDDFCDLLDCNINDDEYYEHMYYTHKIKYT